MRKFSYSTRQLYYPFDIRNTKPSKKHFKVIVLQKNPSMAYFNIRFVSETSVE